MDHLSPKKIEFRYSLDHEELFKSVGDRGVFVDRNGLYPALITSSKITLQSLCANMSPPVSVRLTTPFFLSSLIMSTISTVDISGVRDLFA